MAPVLTDQDDIWDDWLGFDDDVLALKGNDTIRGNGGNDSLWGGEGDDRLEGGRGNDVLHGDNNSETGPFPETDGNDYLYGDEDNDLLVGDGGDDLLDGGTGADAMFGGDGDDYYLVDNAADTVFENFFDAHGHRMVFSSGIDTVFAEVNFTLGSGLENLNLGFWSALSVALNGTGNELGNEIRSYTASDCVIDGREGNDHLYGDNGKDTLIGGDGDDDLHGGWGNDKLRGGRGNDTYYVENSGDEVSELSGDGSDLVFSSVTFTLPDGVEALVLEQGAGAIDGTGNALANAITGNDDSNTLSGLGGDDTLKGGGGDDTIDGGFGNDGLAGDDGIDTVSFASWDPTGSYSPLLESVRIELGQGSQQGIATRTVASFSLGTPSVVETDTLDGFENVRGSNRYETIIGNNAGNILEGRGGNDVLQGNGGSDTLNGGLGSDTASYEHNSGRVIVTLGASGADGTAAESLMLPSGQQLVVSIDILHSIENVRGSAFADQITGNDLDNVLDGRGGVDIMLGGNGNDTYIIDHPGDMVGESANQGTSDRVQTSVSYALTTGSEVEFLETTNAAGTAALNLIGNGFRQTIEGNNGANVINGGVNINAANFDTMAGHGGNDTYIVDANADIVTEAVGEGTSDRVQTSATYVLRAGSEIEVLETTNVAATTALDLVGNEFNNTIIGNNGQNTIVGSPDTDGGGYDGRDIMTGNGGGDVFVWTSTAESSVAGEQADVITDFNRAAGDLIAVNPIDAIAATVDTNDQFQFIGQGPFTGAGQISFFTTATDTFILLNTDGDAAQEMTIRLQGVHAVDASWFVL